MFSNKKYNNLVLFIFILGAICIFSNKPIKNIFKKLKKEKNKSILSPKLLDKYLSANGTINKLLKYAEIVIINNNITN